MPRVIKPDRSNRAESVQQIWKRLGLHRLDEATLVPGIDNLERNFATKRTFPGIVAAMQLTNDVTCAALAARWNGESNSVELLQRAFSYFYWHTELNLIARTVENRDDQVRDSALYDLLNWQGLSMACAEHWFAEWVAPYLHNLFCSGGVAKNSLEFAVDEPARRFTETLQSILITRRWPTEVQAKSFKAYAPLFETANDPASFRAALVDYCDYRTAQCFGYDGIDATNRRKPSQDGSIMDRGGWEQAFPVELFTLKHAFGLATGKVMSLEAEHPLLHTPLMTKPFPALTPLYEDDITRRMQDFGELMFGSHWKVRQPVPARYVQA